MQKRYYYIMFDFVLLFSHSFSYISYIYIIHSSCSTSPPTSPRLSFSWFIPFSMSLTSFSRHSFIHHHYSKLYRIQELGVTILRVDRATGLEM